MRPEDEFCTFVPAGFRVRVLGAAPPAEGKPRVRARRLSTGEEMVLPRDSLQPAGSAPSPRELAERLENAGFIDVSILGAVADALRQADAREAALRDLRSFVDRMTREYGPATAVSLTCEGAYNAFAETGRRLNKILNPDPEDET